MSYLEEITQMFSEMENLFGEDNRVVKAFDFLLSNATFSGYEDYEQLRQQLAEKDAVRK